jgi:hypothetical protein
MGDMLLIGVVVLGSFLFASFILRIDFGNIGNVNELSLVGALSTNTNFVANNNAAPRVQAMQDKKELKTKNSESVPTRAQKTNAKLVWNSNSDYMVVLSEGHKMELAMHLN